MSPESIDLDAAQALADAATPGPWSVKYEVNHWEDFGNRPGEKFPYAIAGPDVMGGDSASEISEIRTEDAEFIAQARTLVPALIAELREERVRSRRHRDYADRLRATLSAHPSVNDEYVTALTVLHHGVLNGPSYGGFNTLHESTRGHGLEAMKAVVAKLDLDGVLKAPLGGAA
jgi:hypothetical protein